MGSWAVPSSGQHLSSELCPVGSLGPSSPSPHHPPLSPQPGASWIADCTRHHCGSTPLGAVLVRSPISCPPLNETECAKVSASHLSLQHGWRPGVLAVLVVVAGRGRGVFWCGDVWKEGFPGIWTCPATLTPPELRISPCIFALTPSYNIRTHRTRVSRCTQTYTHSQHTHIHTNMGSQPLTGTTHSTGPLTPHQASAHATHQSHLHTCITQMCCSVLQWAKGCPVLAWRAVILHTPKGKGFPGGFRPIVELLEFLTFSSVQSLSCI